MEFAGGDVDDRFAALIIPNCQPTSSQEEKLRVCPFARESEIFPGDTQSSWDSQRTGIVMVTLPESSDDYQTPPEQYSYSQNSINDGQVPPTRTAGVDKKLEGAGGGDGEAVVVDETLEREGLRTVDLTNDSDNLGFSEKSHGFLNNNDTDRIEAEDSVDEIEADNGVTEAVAKELIGAHTENAHKVFDDMPMREQKESSSARISNKSVKNIEDIAKFRYVSNGGKHEGFLKEDNGTDVVNNNDTNQIAAEDGVDETEAKNGVPDAVAKELICSPTANSCEVFDEMPMREQKESMSGAISNSSAKNIEHIDKFRYVGSGRKRVLPSSMKQGESTNEDVHIAKRRSHNQAFMDVLEFVLKVLAGEVNGVSDGDKDDDDINFIETADRGGVKFPRPRWWPERFEDQT